MITIKVISVVGYSGTGKTTTIEYIIKALRKRGYSVGTVKEIHAEAFAIDEEGTNTHRHHQAGAELVTARGFYETDILYKHRLSIHDILDHYYQDYVILEGVMEGNFPLIVTGGTTDDVDKRLNERVFLIAGIIAGHMDTYKGQQVLSAKTSIDQIVKLIEKHADDYEPKKV